MQTFNIMDWDGDDWIVLLTIQTNIKSSQLKRIKFATDLIWNKNQNDDCKFCDDLENGDWIEVFNKLMSKLNIPYKEIDIIDIRI